MKLVNVKRLTSVATMLTLSLLCIERPALAQSNCKEARGNSVEVFNPASNSSTGTLTNGGWLDGVVRVKVLANVTTVGSGVGRPGLLNTDSVVPSTGIFAGASGVLFLDLIKSATVAVGPYYEVVGGQVCFAGEKE